MQGPSSLAFVKLEKLKFVYSRTAITYLSCNYGSPGYSVHSERARRSCARSQTFFLSAKRARARAIRLAAVFARAFPRRTKKSKKKRKTEENRLNVADGRVPPFFFPLAA